MLVGSTESVIRFRSEGGFVGTIDNISVRELPGNHATQTILGQRPTYGVVPKNGRRNIYTFSEDFSNAIWAKSTSPGITLTNQGEGVWRLQAGPGEWYLTQALPVSGTHTLSIEVKSNGAGLDGFSLMMQGAFIGGNKTATNEWVRYTVSGTNSASGNAGIVRATSNTAVDILIRFPQLELGSTANPYQRVGSIFDITEVGIPSVGYLAFDGNDKWMVTNTVTPGTDKAQVFVGVNKFGTTSYPVLVELGTGGSGGFVWHGNGLNSSTAYFANYSPPNAVAFFSDGGINQPYVGALLLDRAGTSGALSEIAFRKNGVAISGTQDGSNPDSTGNYLAYPIYIGRRGGTSLPFNGHIYSLIVRFGSNLSAARISAAESWVSTKTQGVTL